MSTDKSQSFRPMTRRALYASAATLQQAGRSRRPSSSFLARATQSAALLFALAACGPAPGPGPTPPTPANNPAPPSPSAAAPSPTPPASQTAAVAPSPAPTPGAPPSAAPPPASPQKRDVTSWQSPRSTPPPVRVQNAQATRTETVKKLFADAGVTYPPAELLFRTFKREKELEVWASSAKGAAMTRVATYEVCSMSGDLGPKRGEGDMQVPEGFYTIQYYWPVSDYHLEMKVGYPNASDKVLGSRQPGGDIMIHGSCASIGCIAMGDERIEELWVMATAFHANDRRVNVHIFPTRDMKQILDDQAYARHRAFWANIKEGLDKFEQSRRLFAVSVDWRGRYSFQ